MFIVCIIHVAEYVFESGNPSVIISEFIKPNIFTVIVCLVSLRLLVSTCSNTIMSSFIKLAWGLNVI